MATYIIAYAYGRMLFSVTQEWWTSSDASFRFPGNELEDYARPVLDLLSMLMLSWLLTPVVTFAAIVLTSAGEAPKHTGRFSISGLIGFATTAAVAIAWIQFLTSDLAPQTYYSHLSHTDAIKEWIGASLPFKIPQTIAATVILFGLTKRWWSVIPAFVAAIALDGIGTSIVASIAEQVTGHQQGGILGGSIVDRYLYTFGRSITVVSAFSTARLLGVRPTVCCYKPQDDATEQSDARETSASSILKSESTPRSP
ncbi:hypothetical protein [Roseiconus lacunae]|uniref:hypothetical protein n=2 Tax=Roseiconus lacunae TaxID=2605694 RepID=UPI00190F2BA5|nr:hypothetical protein [Roseiconus lacunae]